MTTQISTDNIQAATLATIGSAPRITSVVVTDSSYNNLDDTAVDTAGGFVKIIGSGFKTGCTVTVNRQQAASVTFISATELRAQLPAETAGTYVVYVVNSDGSVALRVNGVTFSALPAWTTGSTLPNGDSGTAVSIQLSAAQALTYSVAGGSTLPPGLTLSSGGLLSGTVNIANETLYNFSIVATDAELQDSPRTFSISITVGDPFFAATTLLLPGSTNTFVRDSSTNNFAVSVVGDARPNTFNPHLSGWSNFFDGSGDFLTLPTNAALGPTSGDYTWEAWLYPTALGSNKMIYISSQNSGSLGIGIGQSTANRLTVFRNGIAFDFIGTTDMSVYLNRWVHVAVTKQSGTTKFWIDGVNTDTFTTNHTYVSGGAAASIGRRVSVAEDYTGSISNMRLVNGTAVYTTNFTPSTTPLTAVSGTSLLTCQSNRFVDNSTNNFAITRNGDVVIDSFSPFVEPSNISVPNLYSGYFDGTGDRLTTSASAAQFGTGDFTIEFWINLSSLAATAAIIDFRASGTATFGQIYIATDRTIHFYLPVDIATTNTLTLGAWNHVAISRSSGTLRMFINGVSGYSAASGGTFNAAGSVTIGSSVDGTAVMTGCLSDVRIVAGTGLYAANFTPSTTSLTAVSGTSLLTCQNSRFVDNSTNNFAITSVGQAQPVAVTPFTQTFTSQSIAGSGSGYFDGTGDYITAPANAALQLTGDFTVEAWIYPTAINNFNMVFGSENGANSDYLTIRASTIELAVSNTAYPAWTQTFVTNRWYHIAVTRQSNTLRAFVDGVQLTLSGGSATNSSQYFQSGAGVSVGRYGLTSTPHPFTGYISNARIVKGTAVYTAAFTPPQAPLTPVANTSLLTLQNNQPTNNSMFLDSSTENHLITRVGNTTQGSFSPYSPSGWSNYFDGSGDYLSAPSNAAFAFGTGDFTIEGWASASAFSTLGIFQQSTSLFLNSTTNSLALGLNSNGTFQVYAKNTNTNSTATYSLNNWFHFALVRSGTTTVLYINGVSVITVSADTTNYTGTFFGIGSIFGTTFTFNGYLSNIRVVKGTAVYTANFTPPTQPLTAIANTSLLTCADNRFVDDSPNNFAITRSGDVRVTNFSPFKAQTQTPRTYSAYFDNTGDYLTLATNAAFGFGTGAFTIECWFNTQVIPGAGGDYLFDMRTTNVQAALLAYINTSGGLDVFINGAVVITGGTVVVNTWNHFALTKSGTTTRMFLNGTQVGSSYTDNLNYGSTAPVTIASRFTAEDFYQGYISNFRMVKGTALYTANFTPSTAPLTAVANTSLLTCQSPTFTDNSVNRFAITVFGNSQPTQVNPFGFTFTNSTGYSAVEHGGSLYFDGTGDYLTVPVNAAFNFGTSDFTFECWFNTPSLTSVRNFINNYSGSGAGWGLQWRNDTGAYAFFFGDTTLLSFVSTPAPNTWNHVAVSRAGTSLRMFVNGAVVATATNSTNLTSAAGLTIGDLNAPSQGYIFPYIGYISNLRVVKGQALYTSGFALPIAPVQPVPNTVLQLNGTGAAVTDATTKNVLETVGNVKTEQFGPYNAGYYSNFFDGTGDFLSYTGGATTTIAGNFTFEAWINLNNLSATQPMLCIGDGFSSGVLLAINTSGKVVVFGSNTSILTGTGTSLTAGTWNHVAVVRSGTTITTYVNGVSHGTATNSATFSGTTTVIGREIYNGGVGTQYSGYISNLRLVNGTAVYTAAFTPSTAPLTAIANTSLLTCQSNRFVDNSINNFALTRNGDVKVQTQNPFQNNSGSSMVFDGTGDWVQLSGTNPSLAFGTGAFTVEFWFNSLAASGTQQLFDTRPAGTTSTSGYMALTYLSGSLNYYTAGANPAIAGGTVSANEWHHVALTRSGTSTRLFVNGIQVGSTYIDSQSYLNGLNRPIIGADGNSPSASLTGYVQDLRITTGAARYTANFTPPAAAFNTK